MKLKEYIYDLDINIIIICFTIIISLIILFYGVNISEKRNIEKEIKLKQIEVYGEIKDE